MYKINLRFYNERRESMKLLSSKEAAAIIAEKTGRPMSMRQVQQEIKDGHLKAEKIGRIYFIKESALSHYERGHREEEKNKGK